MSWIWLCWAGYYYVELDVMSWIWLCWAGYYYVELDVMSWIWLCWAGYHYVELDVMSWIWLCWAWYHYFELDVMSWIWLCWAWCDELDMTMLSLIRRAGYDYVELDSMSLDITVMSLIQWPDIIQAVKRGLVNIPATLSLTWYVQACAKHVNVQWVRFP